MAAHSLSQAWELEQLIRLSQQQPDLVSTALQRLLAENDDLRWAMVVGAYLEGQISLGKAAELLGMHPLTLREHFLELGIPLRLGAADEAEARAEVAAVRTWSRQDDEDATP